MLSRATVFVLTSFAAAAGLAGAHGAALSAPAASIHMWPPWVSIESPVNPFDPTTRGALLIVHAALRDRAARLMDVTGSAEGIVDGKRQSIPLRFDGTSQPNAFALRRQWPTDGPWILRISLGQTTALVTLDHAGSIASARVLTESSQGTALPRAVGAREIDSTLAELAKR
jgi:hypothetical protein